MSGSEIVKLVWLVCCNFLNVLAATKHEEMSLVDSLLILARLMDLTFVSERFLGVDFLFEKPEEF